MVLLDFVVGAAMVALALAVWPWRERPEGVFHAAFDPPPCETQKGVL